MCGITGLVRPGAPVAEDVLASMTAALHHRGPDDVGLFMDGDCGLGFRRLSIIDLETGNQPLSNEDGTVQSVFNGEIYNFEELRRRLEQRGHVFRTKGDAEVLPHLYEEYGTGMVAELRGMFGFAIWDAKRRTLFAARDRMGEKPLYYAQLPGGGIAFGSEIKSILHAGVERVADPAALVEFLHYLYIPAPRTGYKDIAQLPPAHSLTWRDGEIEVERYWAPSFREQRRTTEEHLEGLREHVLDAVASRTHADVPLGAFLSGGLDSGSVVAAMREAGTDPLHTFTVTFEGFDAYDESEEARQVAAFFGTQHHELRVELDATQMLPMVVDHFDEPFGNPTALLIAGLSRATRDHAKVALTGDGADELFLGYPRHRGIELQQRVHARVPGPVRRLMAAGGGRFRDRTDGRHTVRRMREFLEAADLPLAHAYDSWVSYFTPDMLADAVEPAHRLQAERAPEFLMDLFRDAGPGLNGVSAVDLSSFLPYNVLHYADKMSMAHGLELRAPFVDHHLVEYVSTMPAALKLHNGTSKWALRQAMGGLLPEISLTKTKRGLNPPLTAWLAGASDVVDDLLSDESVRARGLLRPEAVRALRHEYKAGIRDRALHVWALAVLELWFRRRIDTLAAVDVRSPVAS